MSEKDILINVEGVSKKFCKDLKTSLRYGLTDIWREITGKPMLDELRKNEFYAVKDISFKLKRGECLGLIGHNGAGKSTLLKILNGLIKPDSGKITIKGRVGALIELGAGFNPILTGKENIYINGNILGFSKKEIDRKLDAIIDFAEISDYINTPVRNYSSGMKVRLGFAVAANMEPDVLIIDEVLAVGDLGFRIKCYNRINEILNNAAVILVSHSMPDIGRLASEILLMDRGKSIYNGHEISTGIEKYLNLFKDDKSRFSTGEENIELKDIEIKDENDENLPQGTVNYSGTMQIKLSFWNKKNISKLKIDIGFLDKELRQIALCFSDNLEVEPQSLNTYIITLPSVPFSPGQYSMNIAFSEYTLDNDTFRHKVIAMYKNFYRFSSYGEKNLLRYASIQIKGSWKRIKK